MKVALFPKIEWLADRPQVLICFGLVVFTVLIYGQSVTFDFLHAYDDLEYVLENPQVRKGITAEGLAWAFRTFHAANWHPLTWLSHMLDVELFGMDAGRHHLTNVWLHVVNALLLFWVLNRMTACMWRSALVAALFAWHPLHVESVAMIAERKDMLCGFFWMLSLGVYLNYVRRPEPKRYVLLVGVYILGLLAKPMMVTLPFVLLLIDLWPLKRWRWGTPVSDTAETVKVDYRTLIYEKLPLVLLSMAAAVVTWLAQASKGAVQSYPFGLRLFNALVSYGAYLGKTVWPDPLAVFYPFRETVSLWKLAAVSFLIVAVTLLALINLKRRPFIFVGWFWYLGTLVPVIGLVQVGSQAMADRYTYIPLIGIFVIIAWGLGEIAARSRVRVPGAMAAAVAVLMLLMLVLSYRQARLWSDDQTLFGHAVAVSQRNWLAHNNLGIALSKTDQKEAALKHFQRASEIKPDYADARFNLAVTLAELGRRELAVAQYQAVLRIAPHHSGALNNLGGLLIAAGRIAAGANYCRKALLVDPTLADAHNNLAVALTGQGMLVDAADQFRQALVFNPDDAEARLALAELQVRTGDMQAAREAFNRAVASAPRNRRILKRAADFFLGNGDYERAERLYGDAIRYGADDAQIYGRIGAAAAARKRSADAVVFFETALEKDRTDPYAARNLENAREALNTLK